MISGYLTWLSVLGMIGFIIFSLISMAEGDMTIINQGGWGTLLVTIGFVVWKLRIARHTPLLRNPAANLMITLGWRVNPHRDADNNVLGFTLLQLSLSVIPVLIKGGLPYYLVGASFLPILALLFDGLHANYLEDIHSSRIRIRPGRTRRP